MATKLFKVMFQHIICTGMQRLKSLRSATCIVEAKDEKEAREAAEKDLPTQYVTPKITKIVEFSTK